MAVLFLKRDYVLYLTVVFSSSITPSSHNCLKVSGLFVFQGSMQMSPALHSHNTVLVLPMQWQTDHSFAGIHIRVVEKALDHSGREHVDAKPEAIWSHNLLVVLGWIVSSQIRVLPEAQNVTLLEFGLLQV